MALRYVRPPDSTVHLDADAYEALKGRGVPLARLAREAVAEYARRGARRAARRVRHGSQVGGERANAPEVPPAARVAVLLPDEPTSHHYAAVLRQLRHQGTPIPTNDVWLAARVLQHQLVLHSRDAHFDHLPQILRV